MMFKDVENNNLETDVFQNVEILFRNGKLLVGFRNYDDWEIFREQTGIHHSYYQNEIMFSFCDYSENREENETRSIISFS